MPADWADQSETGHQGNVILASDTISGITKTWPARVTANTALAPGGTCDLTIDIPTPDLSFGSFELYMTGGGAGVVYRKYAIDPDFAAAIQQAFP